MIEIYVDGSCRAHGAEGGWGAVIYEDGHLLKMEGQQYKDTTNNRMEISAILYAIENFGKENPIVYTDSQYCYNTFTKWMYGWKNNGWLKGDGNEPQNLDLIKTYYNFIKNGYKINLKWIKGHNGTIGNELADKIATGELKIS